MNEEIKGLLQALIDGKELQWGIKGHWKDLNNRDALLLLSQKATDRTGIGIRTKPDTIMINKIEVPAPERTAPATGIEYFVLNASHESGFFKANCGGSLFEDRLLQRGQVWLKEGDIKQVVKALGWTE